jgi:hypothetical protein
MTAIGVKGVLIIATKDIADLESAPHYVLARTKPFPPHSNGGVALWAALSLGSNLSVVGLPTATSILGVCGHAGAFPQVSRLAAAATYWTRDQCLHILAGSLSGRDVNRGHTPQRQTRRLCGTVRDVLLVNRSHWWASNYSLGVGCQARAR